MIILEGMDRCGKSTVARALRELLPGWSYRHHTKPPMDPFGYFAQFIADSHPRVIVDRFHWSEPAYGKTYRHGSGLTKSQWRTLELMCLGQNAQIIYMYDHVESIKARWDDSEMFPAEPLNQLCLEYATIKAASKVANYSYTLPDLIDAKGRPTERLEAIAAAERFGVARRQKYQLPPSIAYGAHGGFMIVGESPSERELEKSPDVQAPFKSGPASEVLWKALDDHSIAWWNGHYTNASEFTVEGFKEYAEWVDPTKIVLLGNVAQKLMPESQRAAPHVPRVIHLAHPAYVKRFQNEMVEGWSTILADHLSPWKVRENA